MREITNVDYLMWMALTLIRSRGMSLADVESAFERIGQFMKENSFLENNVPTKEVEDLTEWFKKYFPPLRYQLGLKDED